MDRQTSSPFLCAACALMFFATVSFTQVETARIIGTVRDASGAVVPGAAVTINHVVTNSSFSTVTGPTGRYISVPLRIGEYEVQVEATGFKRGVRKGIVLRVQESAVIDFTLELGALSEQVSVTADAPLLTVTEATQGQVIENKRIVDMPLNGRDYMQLALLSEGAVQPLGNSRYGGFSAGGQRTTQNNYLLDGVDNNNVQLAAQGRRGEAVKPSIDAIQEFKISTNAYSAEYGRATGGVVNVTIKSGSNDFHGTAFEFLRNDRLDAKNFFDRPDEPKPPFKRNQFGFSAGGPIRKNKTFIFGDYEWTKIRESRTVNNTIPTLAERTGDFSASGTNIFDPDTYNRTTRARQPFPGNAIPAARIDPIARAATAWYPQPQNENLTRNFLYNPPNNENQDKWDVRVDQILSSQDNVYYRASLQKDVEEASPSLPAPAYGTGENATPFTHRGVNMALVWNHVFSPSMVNSTRIAWNRLFTDREPPLEKNMNAELGLRGVDQYLAGAPSFAITGVTSLGIGANTPNLVDSQNRQLISDTTWTTRSHSMKWGINFSWLQSYISNPKQALGAFQFNGNFSRDTRNARDGNPFADFLLGIPRQTTVARPVHSNLRAPYYQFYVQDEWRATPKLTLNLGLRYDLNMQWVETQDRLANVDFAGGVAKLVVAGPGSRFDRALIRTDSLNFAPRVGFAYRVLRKTVLRGGYGIFYANYEGTGGGRFLLGNPPATIAVQITTDGITPAFLLRDGVPGEALSPSNVKNLVLTSFEYEPDWPLSQQWNFNIQHELAKDLLWQVGYFGTKSNHLPTRWDGNFAPPAAGNINNRRPYRSIVYPGTDITISPLAQMDAHNFLGNSLYHSVQTKVERRFSGGFSVLASYIFSRAIGDVDGFSGSGTGPNSAIQDPRNLRAERSLDNQHVKHRLVASYLYDLPLGSGRRWGSSWGGFADGVLGGWSISGITTLTSGLPMGLSVQGDPANTGSLNRPNVVGEPHLSRSERTLDRYFNTQAFVANAQYTLGNAGRNILLQPGRVNFDLALFKRFTVAESKFFQFRFEMFNAFNTPPFGAPNLAVGNRDFGRITSAGLPRILQFGLKFVF